MDEQRSSLETFEPIRLHYDAGVNTGTVSSETGAGIIEWVESETTETQPVMRIYLDGEGVK